MKIQTVGKLDIPEGVTIKTQGRVVSVKGPRGSLKKDISHLNLDLRVNDKKKLLTVVRWFGRRTDVACINTAISTIKNLVIGVTKGFRYKLRFASAHFPINVTVDGQNVEIRNFLGEKRVRRQTVREGVKVFRTDVKVTKDELVLEGNSIEDVSQEAAQIHQLCLVKNKDIRKFLDGIYVQTKENIVKAE
uniref:Large ribosomal subunit protein uL6 alpha-beta domain-containing protein n=1 Tax=Heterosigma akashiwo TaxID=2829 RepID=A0A7S3Y1Z2_HETAK